MTRKKRVSKGNWSTDSHSIFGDKGQIFRVAQSGDVWQFRMWIADEGKAVRKSLRTRDFEAAVARAETEVLEILSNLSTGKKLFGATLQELVDLFLGWRQKDVAAKLITQGRYVVIKSQTKHFLNFKPSHIKLNELDRNSFYEYEVWRRSSDGGEAQPVTIRNEQATLNQMYKYAFREGYTSFDKFSFREIRISRDQIGRRSIFTLEEYDQLIQFLRTYVSKKACPNDAERKERLIMRDCVLLASNTVLRPGELWQLEWRDILDTMTIKDAKGLDIQLVKIRVRAEISKVGSERIIISRGGQYIERLKRNSQYLEPNHFVIASVNGTRRMDRRKLDKHWKNMMIGINVPDYSERKLVWYSLRHFGITCRIRAGVKYSDIASMAGTSVTNIETHYGHYDDQMKISSAIKTYDIDENGIITSI